MRKSMWRPLVIALALALGSAVVYADKAGPHPHGDDDEGPVLRCVPGQTIISAPNTVEICASNFEFDPPQFDGGGTVDWFNRKGNHNVSICDVDTANQLTGVCGRGNVISSQDLGEGESVSFDFGSFAGETVDYFCRFHGKSKGMVGTVNVPS